MKYTILTILAIFPLFAFSQKCESDTTFTEWYSKDVSRVICQHNWVYADYEDVNPLFIVFSADTICPCYYCDTTKKEARICRNCLRHEERTMSVVWREKLNEYQQLLKRKNGNK